MPCVASASHVATVETKLLVRAEAEGKLLFFQHDRTGLDIEWGLCCVSEQVDNSGLSENRNGVDGRIKETGQYTHI